MLLQGCAISNVLTISKIEGLKKQTGKAMVDKCYVIEPPTWIEMLKDKEGAAWEKMLQNHCVARPPGLTNDCIKGLF